MARTAFNAPAHRVLQRTPLQSAVLPVGCAPSLDFAGNGLQDHRLQYNFANSATGAQALGFYGNNPTITVNQAPSTIATANIAALANVTGGTAMTLVSASGAGITVISTATTLWPSLVSISAGLIIDTAPAFLTFGTARTGITGFYDRTTMISRAVSITGVSGGGAAASFLVSGYDVYGYAMSELITAPSGATTANGKKAFKIVTSVVPTTTDAHNYSVGTTDIYSLGLYASVFSEVEIFWNNALITATTGFTAGVTTSPATTTTGDVRGTYATQDASDGTKKLLVKVYPSLTAMATNATTGLFGVTQV